MAPQRRAQPKRNRKVSDRMALVDDEDRKQAQTLSTMQARLDALEEGVDEDALAVGDDDDEFDAEEELAMDGKAWLAVRSKTKKRKGGKHALKVAGVPTASSFAVLLEESGVYEDKLPEPHYLTAETEPARVSAPRTFCQICGSFAKYRCIRCREPFCCRKCNETHNELRCLKFTL